MCNNWIKLSLKAHLKCWRYLEIILLCVCWFVMATLLSILSWVLLSVQQELSWTVYPLLSSPSHSRLMGICISTDQLFPKMSTSNASLKHHPQGVAGLPADQIDEQPEHPIIPGIVASNPFVEVHKTTIVFSVIKTIFKDNYDVSSVGASTIFTRFSFSSSFKGSNSEGSSLHSILYVLNFHYSLSRFMINFCLVPRNQAPAPPTMEKIQRDKRSTLWKKEDWLRQGRNKM